MSSIVIAGDTSGTVTLQAPAVAGSTTVNLPSTPGNNGASAVVTTNASGNLGLGVTPSAWGTDYFKAIQGAGTGSFQFQQNANGVKVACNSYFNSSQQNIYIASDFATQYYQTGGQHRWLTAASGTAGNAFSFTQAMTLDASGRLLVGTTTAADSNAMLNVYNPNATSAQITIQNTTTGTGSNGSRLLANGNDLYITNKEAGFMAFETNDTERARITSAGDVAIGSTTTSGSKLYVQGVAQATGGVQDSAIEAWLGDDGSYGKTGTRAAIKAVTSGVGRGATPYGLWVSCTDIDVGTCISAYNLANGVYGTQTATLSEVSKDLGAYSGGYCHYAKATTTSSGGTVNFYFGEHNGTTRYIVYLNGGIANYQANNVNLSDRREKTDFAPAKNYLDTICAIPVQTFKYIDQTDDAPTLGVVAQDVQAVAPELVCESDWASEGEEKKMRLSIYQTDLQYALMKCIQELNAKVEALTAELNTLKGQA